VSYYEEELMVDLFDQSEWKSTGINTPLVYQPLIDQGILVHTVGNDYEGFV